jgi:3-oxoacyl-[acyl-carrier protein] reductase
MDTQRVALITGSSKGLGKAMAMSLGAQGCAVALNYCHGKEKAEETFAEFTDQGYRGVLVQANAIDTAEVTRMCAEVRDTLGPIDILIPNATGPQPLKSIEDYDWAFYQEMIDFFIKSPYLLTRACLPHMKEQRWGRIINIGSEVFDRGVGNFSAYVAAKGGQRGWTRSMANELAPWNITVNMVSPGWIPVERHDNDPADLKAEYLAEIPLGRWGVPNDIACACRFLASEDAGFITGQTLVVNGGLTTC